MLDTPNWSVKPTALSARIAEVTSPKPTARVNWFMWRGSAVQYRARNDRDRVHRLAGRVVVVERERPLGAVVLIEGERPARADVLDLLASLEGSEPCRVAVHLHGTGDHGGHLG